MLITNQSQQDELHIIRHKSCAWCHNDLDYPRIMADDTGKASYHIDCTLALVAAIMADLQTLFEKELSTDMVKKIEALRLMGGTVI